MLLAMLYRALLAELITSVPGHVARSSARRDSHGEALPGERCCPISDPLLSVLAPARGCISHPRQARLCVVWRASRQLQGIFCLDDHGTRACEGRVEGKRIILPGWFAAASPRTRACFRHRSRSGGDAMVTGRAARDAREEAWQRDKPPSGIGRRAMQVSAGARTCLCTMAWSPGRNGPSRAPSKAQRMRAPLASGFR